MMCFLFECVCSKRCVETQKLKNNFKMKQSDKNNEDDVIEIGEDGSFDISTPPKIIKQNKQQIKQSETQSTLKKNNNNNSNSILPEEILNLVPIGEYKIFTTPSSKELFLIIHLQSDEKPQKVYLKDENLLVIEIKDDYSLTVDLSSLHIDKTSIHSTIWQNFLTFRFFKQNP